MSELFLRPLFTWRSAIASQFGPPSPTTRHVLLTLSLHMNEKGGSCFPSTKLLAEETGLTERAVCTHLELSESDGWIMRRNRIKAGQKWKSYEYTPVIPLSAASAFEALNDVQQLQATEAGSVTSEKVLNVIPEGTERQDKKALKDVQRSTSVNSSRNSSYTTEFEKAWETYPKRAGNNPKQSAFKAWKARIKVDVHPDAMTAGVERYAAFVRATGKEYTEFVMMAATFFGPDCRYDQAWTTPRPEIKKDIDPWWVDEKGIDRKGKELGLKPLHAEDYPHFKARIWAEIRKREAVTT